VPQACQGAPQRANLVEGRAVRAIAGEPGGESRLLGVASGATMSAGISSGDTCLRSVLARRP